METPSALSILFLLLLFQVKHAVCDGLLQTRWMLDQKGIYGKPGGLAHAGVHLLGSFLALMIFGVGFTGSIGLAVTDAVIHYHIDFSKELVAKQQGWTPRDTYFWWLLTADQALHHFTYLAMAAAVVMLG
jgi:hypothetical protein